MKMPFKYGCVVEGEFFCPRPILEQQLRRYAESGQDLVIQGERRIGKTSLVRKSISAKGGKRLLYVDFYGIRTLPDFCRRIMTGIGAVSDKMPFLKKALTFASRLRPALTVDANTGAPTLTIDARVAADPDSLGTAMATIGKLAAESGLCVVMDEFQDILKLGDSEKILAEMRGTIQFQQDVPYFFMGSSRNEMLRIFTHYDSPFFKSALPFEVPPIDENEFAKFIVARFRKGGCRIDEAAARAIIEIADGISGDVQELCDAMWNITEEGGLATVSDIPQALSVVFSREKNGFDAAIADLTPNQLSVLAGIATLGGAKVFSSEFLGEVGVAGSGSVRRALNSLVAARLIQPSSVGYRFCNPFFREWLKRGING